MIQFSNLYEYEQIRFVLPADTTGLLDTVELSIEYQTKNLNIAELWVRIHGDNVRGKILDFEPKNKDCTVDSFQQDLITQVNKMPDINEYIDAWIWRRQKEEE